MNEHSKDWIESFKNLNPVNQSRILQVIFNEETQKTLENIEGLLLKKFKGDFEGKYQTWINILKIKNLMGIKYFILSDVDYGEILGKYLYNDFFDYDLIYIPNLDNFNCFDDFLFTLLHEIAHLTGSYKRLRRKGVNCGNINRNYAKEELRAEFSSQKLADYFNIYGEQRKNRGDIIKDWLNIINDDSRVIRRVNRDSDQIFSYIKRLHLNNCEV